MEYQNFDLTIESKLGDGYQVKVQSETMGEADGVFTLSEDCLKIAAELKDIAALQDGSSLPMNLGVSLHQCLFQKSVASMLYKSLGAVLKEDEKGLRIRLRLSPPEIAALPWEVLYDQESKSFVSTSGKTPLTRYIEIPEPIRALKIAPPVKVLVLIPGGSGLDVDNEERIIAEALKELGAVQLHVLKGKVTRAHISRALVEEQYHILHFIGHGTFEADQGYLLINSEDGGHDRLSADVFADFFRDYASLKLVVLNSCQGAEVSSTRELAGMAPQLVVRGTPAVIAMQYPISDDAALVFAREFYLKLCSGWSRGQVDAAISHARNRIHMDVKEPMAFATPVLFMRAQAGIIFDFEQQQPSLVQRILELFTSAPVANVNRLRQVKVTYEKNIEAWSEKAKEASPETVKEAMDAIAREKQEITGIDDRIIKWNRTFLAALVATFIIFLLGYLGLFNRPFQMDDWLEIKFIPSMDAYLGKRFSPEVRIIMADEGENGGLGKPGPDWRQYHAQLVDALTKARAKVIVFDLEMNDPTPYDKQFAEAIKRARADGTAVVLSKGLEVDGALATDLAPELKEGIKDHWGNIKVGGQVCSTCGHGGFVRLYQLAQPAREGFSGSPMTEAGAVVPSLGLRAVAESLSKSPSIKAVDDDTIQIASDGRPLRSIPVNKNNQAVYDFPYNLAEGTTLRDNTRPYRDVYARREEPNSLQEYEGKIVVIGYKDNADLHPVFQGELRYGAEIQANVISNILSEVYVKVPPPSYNFLIVALMAALGALVQARFKHVFNIRITLPLGDPKKRIEISGLLLLAEIVYLLVAFVLYKNSLIFILKSYHLFAPFIAYWLTGKMRKKAALKPVRGVES
jgi:CHASE2 domain-containing sensor protein